MTRSTGTSGLIFAGVAADAFHGGTHGGEVYGSGNAGEVLEQDAGWLEGDLGVGGGGGIPGGKLTDIGFCDLEAVATAEAAFQEDLDGIGKTGNAREPGLFEGGQAEVLQVSGFGGERCLRVQGSCHNKSAFRGDSRR